jgi:hypothetical protein
MDTAIERRSSVGCQGAQPWHVTHKARELILAAGHQGPAFKLVSGAAVLEDVSQGEPRFAGLALPGDLLGMARVPGHGALFSVRALIPTQVRGWAPHAAIQWDQGELLQHLLAQHHRTAEMMALRHGHTQERLLKLFELLDPGAQASGLELPTLKDLSFVTGITGECICRELGRLRKDGRVTIDDKRHLVGVSLH